MDNNSFLEKRPYSRFKAALIFLFVFIIVICFYPYEFQSCYPKVFPQEGPLLQIVCTLATLIVFTISKRYANLPTKIWPLLIIQLLGFSLCFIVQGQPQVIIVQMIIMTLVIMVLALINATIGLVTFFKYYNRWIMIMAILGTVGWALSIFAGFQPFYAVPDRIDSNREIYNYFLTFSVHDSYNTAMRYSGFFDEPGAMANWGLFALIINKLFVNDKKIELPLIICLIFTFSMGFYVQLLLYYFFFYFKKSNLKQGIVVILATVAVLYFLSTLRESQGVNRTNSIYEMTIGRFTNMFQEGREKKSIVAVDDRRELAQIAKQEFLDNPLFGTSKPIYLGDNIYEPLAMYGLVGTFFIYFPIIWLLVYAYKRGDKSMVNATFIIIIGFLHRPYHRNLLWNLILYGIIIMFVLYRKKKLSTLS